MVNHNTHPLLLTILFSLGILSFSAFYIYETLRSKKFLSEMCRILTGKVHYGLFGSYLLFSKNNLFYRLQLSRLYAHTDFGPGNNFMPEKVFILICFNTSNLSFAIERIVWNMQLSRAVKNFKTFKYQDADNKTSYHIIARDKKIAQKVADNEVFKLEVKYLLGDGFNRIECTKNSIKIYKYNYRLDEINVDVIFNYMDHLVKIREALFPK